MRETQATIWAWRLATFGPPTSLFRIVTRANEEMAELLRKVAVGTHAPAEIAEEAADVAIVLYGAASLLDFDLEAEVELPASFAGIVRISWISANFSMAWALLEAASPVNFRLDYHAQCCFQYLKHGVAQLGLSIGDAIDAKMAINRAREWKLDGTGHGYHVRNRAQA